ncbi:MAG: phospho-sugar mutase [Micrococcales bacterium]
MDDLLARATAWAAQDPDAETRAELEALIAAGDTAALQDRMGKRIGFGTAGLRGELGAGSNRMNRVLVAQAAAGIAQYLNAHYSSASVVIGFDGRINSDVFAKDSAEIFAAAGIETHLFDQKVPTPVLAFAVKQRGYTAGVMVTASHNPPRDNGYKVYLGEENGGGQIVSPTDKDMSALIETVAATKTFTQIAKSNNYSMIGDDLIDEYADVTRKLIDQPVGPQLRIVYSAMHGVGWRTTKQLFAVAGVNEPIVVDSQIEPDGSFPTVAFPNPEEPGAMDLSFETARAVDADLILVNDPDADRLAVAIPDSTSDAGYRRLTGDQVGLLLGDEIARRAKAHGQAGAFACSIVSCSGLGKVAETNGFEFAETLTGFKWISKVPGLLFGFEEALGYCVDPQHVADKDGISAALVMAGMANRLAAAGKTVADALAELTPKYGAWATSQISLRFESIEKVTPLIEAIRENPPIELAGKAATFTDLARPGGKLPPTDGLRFDLADGRRVIIRASGTEPKLKCYLQASAASDTEANELLSELREAVQNLLN